jgi:GNAT superfamily N-acetyltransferase
MDRKRKSAQGKPARTVKITVRPLQNDDWPIIEELFGDKGACGGCWCMWPRVPKGGKTWKEALGAKNRTNFRRLIESGEVHGVLAFHADEPVGWCSFGPRRTFPRLERVRALQRKWDDGTWSIVCFYIPSRWRGRGVATRLLKEATKRAFALGAREVEGYPVVPWDPTTKVPAAFAWTGVPALFEEMNYRELPREGATRPIYVKGIRRARPAK